MIKNIKTMVRPTKAVNFERISDARLIKAWRLATQRMSRYGTWECMVWHFQVINELDKRGL